MATEPDEVADLLRRAAAGDSASLGELLARHRERLRRLVALRLDPRVSARLDASDVLQDVCLEATHRLAEYLRNPAMPFFLWLRLLTGQKVNYLHRLHLGAEMRAAGREVSIEGPVPEASSAALAAHLLGHDTQPSEAAVRAERKRLLQQALGAMDPLDREILALRHFEQLSNAEAAQVLDVKESAASKRYVRAVKKLKEIIEGLPGGLSGI
jgi:RNA polymerase sigma-70 factor (ECF subfamily)